MMKKLFFSILALAAFVACQDNFEEVSFDAPQVGGGGDDVEVNENRLVTIFAEVAVGEDSRATYGENLSAMWEKGDQIALLQESANYGNTFSTVNRLNILEGSGTGSATFNGDITVSTASPRIYHIAYPASAVSFSTSSSLTAVDVSYKDSYTLPGFDNVTATGVGQYTYNSTLNITLPTSQSGKWEPYMYASTSEAVSSNAIGANTLTTLTGAIAIRAFENDGTTPKQLRSITVEASKPIAGAFSGTATSVGRTTSVSGAETGNKSNVSNTAEEIRAMALNNLLAKLQGMQPATTSVTKAMSFSFTGSATIITADVSAVGTDSNGNYTYHLNVAPFENADLTLTVTATDGSTLVREVSAQSLAASHRKGYIFTWEAASLTNGSIESWYDSYAGNHSTTLEGSKVYVNNIVVEGIEASAVKSIGAVVYDLNDNIVAQNLTDNTLSLSQVVVDVEAAGTYKVCSYAVVVANGEELTLKGEVKQMNITPIPLDDSVIQSSYSKNGVTSLTNSIGGTTLEYTPKLNVTFPANLVKSCQLTYGSTTENVTWGSKGTKNLALGQYNNCSVTTTLGNGYVCKSGDYTTHITGIPFTMTTSSNADGWSVSGPIDWNKGGGVRLGYGVDHFSTGATSLTKGFHIPANISVSLTSNGTIRASLSRSTTFNIYVGGNSVYSTYKEGRGDAVGWTCNATGTMSSTSPNIQLHNSKSTNTCNTNVKALTVNYNL